MLQELGTGLNKKANSGEGGVLGNAFQYPVRLLQGFGMSLCLVIIFIVITNSTINSGIFFLNVLRTECVAYRESLGTWQTLMDDEGDFPGVPQPPYSYNYSYVSMIYTIVESLYTSGSVLFDTFIVSVTLAAIAGTSVVGAGFIFSWGRLFASYRKQMFQIRENPSLIDEVNTQDPYCKSFSTSCPAVAPCRPPDQPLVLLSGNSPSVKRGAMSAVRCGRL